MDTDGHGWLPVGDCRLHRCPSVFIRGWAAGVILFWVLVGLADGGDFLVERDVPYLGEGRIEKADLYIPVERGTTLRPAVVDIHGGGWAKGDKGDRREVNICTNLAANGYVAMSINYRLQTQHGPPAWPQNLHDCKTAVRWLRASAGRLRVDPGKIGVIGGSADETVDVEQSRVFAAALEKAGIEHELVIVEGAPHTFHLQPKEMDLRPVVIGFFNRHLKGL